MSFKALRTTIGVGLSALVLTVTPAVAEDWEASGSAEVELRWFLDDPAHPEQFGGLQPSLILNPELEYRSQEGRHQLGLEAFFRLDGEDDERTNVDLREAYWRYIGDGWELLAGVNKVFWGVTESRHLVNIVNQTDTVEDIDEEDKLGQPMLNVALQRGWGRLEGYALLGFRERTFPGREGRLRTPLPVDTEPARYESGAEDRRVDLALRYAHFIGDWDIGASYFYGTSREPRLLPASDGRHLVPLYEVIQQLSVDLQYTRGAWLWKLEGIVREG